jgi:hypothetical protein
MNNGEIDMIEVSAVFLSESRSVSGREGGSALSGVVQHKMIASRNTLPCAAKNVDVSRVNVLEPPAVKPGGQKQCRMSAQRIQSYSP